MTRRRIRPPAILNHGEGCNKRIMVGEGRISPSRSSESIRPACFRFLLANPQLGRSAEQVALGLRRIR